MVAVGTIDHDDASKNENSLQADFAVEDSPAELTCQKMLGDRSVYSQHYRFNDRTRSAHLRVRRLRPAHLGRLITRQNDAPQKIAAS
ncbi:hypothetical protein [Bradyrhizobium sp.]|uniref:hypothetical protein n=1 Tax=Bradyrhizobium sp. TaxID=376 RepID=UPI003C27BEAC